MVLPSLTARHDGGLIRVGMEGCQRGVSFAFVGRVGGVSAGRFSTLNVGTDIGDEAAAVEENRRRALSAIGVCEDADVARTVSPRQVHGSDVVCVNASDAVAVASAQRRAREGADAIVVSATRVPVLMVFADCVPVVLVAPGAFSVVHAGWRGAYKRVAARAAITLASVAGCSMGDLWAYLGPHISAASYQVSDELAKSFAQEFDGQVLRGDRHLDLGEVVSCALMDAGVPRGSIIDADIDTATHGGEWFSYRSEAGETGRHAAVAWMPSGTA